MTNSVVPGNVTPAPSCSSNGQATGPSLALSDKSAILSRYRELVRQKKALGSGEKSRASPATSDQSPTISNPNTPSTKKKVSSNEPENSSTTVKTKTPAKKPGTKSVETSSISSTWAMMGDLDGTFADSFDHIMKNALADESASKYGIDDKEMHSLLGNLNISVDASPGDRGMTELENVFNAEVSRISCSKYIERDQLEKSGEDIVHFEEDENKDSEESVNQSFAEDDTSFVQSIGSLTPLQSFEVSERDYPVSAAKENVFDETLETTACSVQRHNSMEMSVTNSRVVSDGDGSSSEVSNTEESKCDSLSVARVCSSVEIMSADMDFMSPMTPMTSTAYVAYQNSRIVQSYGESTSKSHRTQGIEQTPSHEWKSKRESLSPQRMSLVERNKTLVKEVRFADQTCIELSERIRMIEAENGRLQNKLFRIKRENESMHDAVVRSAKHGAETESKLDILSSKIQDQKERYEMQLTSVTTALEEAKQQMRFMAEQVDGFRKDKASLESQLSASRESNNSISSELIDSKKTVSELMERLIVANTAAELHKLSEESRMDEKDNCIAEAQLLALDDAKEEIRNYKATISVLEHEIGQQNEEVKELKMTLVESQEQRKAENEELHSLRMKFCELEDAKNDARSQLAEKEEEVRNCRATIAVLENDVEQHDSMLQKAEMKLRQDLERVEMEKGEQSKHYRQLLHETTQEKDGVAKKLKDNEVLLENIKMDRDRISEEMRALKERTSSSEDEIRKKTEENQNLFLKSESLQRKNTRLKDYVTKLTSKCEEWSDSYRVLLKDRNLEKQAKNDALRQLGDCMGQIQALSEEIKNCNPHGDNIHCEECKYLRRAVATEGKRYSAVREELDKKEAELLRLRKMLKKVMSNQEGASSSETLIQSSQKTSFPSSMKSSKVVREHKKRGLHMRSENTIGSGKRYQENFV